MLNLKKGLILTNRVSGNGRTITDIKKDKHGEIVTIQFDNDKWIDAKKLHNFRLPTESDLVHGKQESYGRQNNVAESSSRSAASAGKPTAATRSAKATGRSAKSK